MHSAAEDHDEARALIARCLDGDGHAARRFQELYGELVYGYPMRVFRVPSDEAGDFYVFAFESGRIFRRLRTYEGRAPLRAYLLGFVLDDLVLEWKRGERSLDTVSLDDVGEFAASDRMGSASTGSSSVPLDHALAEIDTAKAVVFKLLHAEDCELSDAEIRHIAQVSGRSVVTVLDAVDQLRAGIREREASLRAVEDNLDSVQSWIQLFERRIARLTLDLRDDQSTVPRRQRLAEEKSELERKLANRRRQRAKLVEEVRRRKVTAPYKEIAQVLNTTVGNIGSQVARVRAELGRRFADSAPDWLANDREGNAHEPLYNAAR